MRIDQQNQPMCGNSHSANGLRQCSNRDCKYSTYNIEPVEPKMTTLLIGWIRWWFWETRKCRHEASHWVLVDIGRKKIRYCDSCGKCLQII